MAVGGRSTSRAAEDADVQAVIDRVREKARKAGLGPIAHQETEHFLGLGDAPARYREPALKGCEALAKEFLAYFRERGFAVAFPKGHLTLVTLKDDSSYRAYIGEDPGAAVGGHYDRESNQLVVFNFESQREELADQAGRVNSFTLAHEAAHLLCFNTGLLSPQADVPVCISEGLATYIELWRRPRDRSFGAINRPRLRALRDAGADEIAWIPIAELLAQDDWFDQAKTQQLAYAESWLLVHRLMTPAWRPKFRAYLAGMPKAGAAPGRVAYAEARLGSLAALDREIKRHARELLRR